MPGNYELTHKKILESATEKFLEKGYERTSLRDVCKDAHVTVGAFYNHFKDKESLFGAIVEPCIQGLMNMYDSATQDFFEALSQEVLMSYLEISIETVKELIAFIYENETGFRLLLCCSEGTKYATFIEDIVAKEDESAICLIQALSRQTIPFQQPQNNVIHMVNHAYMTSIFQCVVHEYDKEKALETSETISRFFNAGWRSLLGIQ